MPFGMVQDFDFHPYEADVRVCTFPEAGVLRADAEALVCHAAYDQVVLRHYAFADRWFKVNVTTDPDGNLIEVPAGDGRSAYAFTIDIATPMVVAGNATYSVDLDIDVLVRADTVTYVVGDEEAFAESVRLGRFSPGEVRGARLGLADLVSVIERGGLLGLLQDVHPFGPCDVPAALPVLRAPLSAFPQLQPGKRLTWMSGPAGSEA